jgi:hypothetical protein
MAIAALPLSMAQACQTSIASDTACCRAMRFACHGSQAPQACCLRATSVPAPGALPLPAQRASVHAPVFAVAAIPAAAAANLLDPSARYSRTPFEGHSPPGNVPIFVLYSTLLI